MRPEDLLKALTEVGDDLLEETDALRRKRGTAFRGKEEGSALSAAEPAQSNKVTDIRAGRRNWRKWTALAASLALLLVAGSLVFRAVTMRKGSMSSATADGYMYESAKESAAGAEIEMAAENEMEVNAEEPMEATALAEDCAAEAHLLRVITYEGEVVIELNDSMAAQDLLAQLPLTVGTKHHGENGIAFQPPQALDATDGIEGGGDVGTLGYYAPDNTVVLFYGDVEARPGFYLLGEAVEGADLIAGITGEVTIEG